MIKILLFSLLFQLSCSAVVSCQLKGQLGNQMFQIATALALANRNKDEVSVPELNTCKGFDVPSNHQHFFQKINSKPINKRLRKHVEKSHEFSPIPYMRNMKIHGYFQSEQYFADCKSLVKEAFSPDEKIMKYLQAEYSNILSLDNTVAIHLRTYRKEDPQNKLFYLCSREYFECAVALFPEDTLFIIFSDDIEFTKEYLKDIAQNVLFMPRGQTHYDFWLMSHCKHQIISNSTFSWWAAWLNPNPSKVVVAPKDWFSKLNDRDIPCQDWVILENLPQ